MLYKFGKRIKIAGMDYLLVGEDDTNYFVVKENMPFTTMTFKKSADLLIEEIKPEFKVSIVKKQPQVDDFYLHERNDGDVWVYKVLEDMGNRQFMELNLTTGKYSFDEKKERMVIEVE